MAIFVAGFIESDFPLAVGTSWDHGNSASFAKAIAQGVGIIAFIGDQIPHTNGLADQSVCNSDVGHIARRQEQGKWPSKDICQGMDFCCLSAPAGTNILRSRPPFPPKAARWAFT